MGRTDTPVFGLVLMALLATCPLTATGQNFTHKPKSPTPDDLPGKQLIVWSETQKPQPLPASSPERYTVPTQTQVLSGIIVARNSELFLAGADRIAFRITNQEQVSEFTGKKVRVTGKLDAHAQILRVLNIEELK